MNERDWLLLAALLLTAFWLLIGIPVTIADRREQRRMDELLAAFDEHEPEVLPEADHEGFFDAGNDPGLWRLRK